MKLSDVNWDDELDVHDIIVLEGHVYPYRPRLMWRGYGRFTNLDAGSEWFVEDSHYDFDYWEREWVIQ